MAKSAYVSPLSGSATSKMDPMVQPPAIGHEHLHYAGGRSSGNGAPHSAQERPALPDEHATRSR